VAPVALTEELPLQVVEAIIAGGVVPDATAVEPWAYGKGWTWTP
jgi:hypothetical protein